MVDRREWRAHRHFLCRVDSRCDGTAVEGERLRSCFLFGHRREEVVRQFRTFTYQINDIVNQNTSSWHQTTVCLFYYHCSIILIIIREDTCFSLKPRPLAFCSIEKWGRESWTWGIKQMPCTTTPAINVEHTNYSTSPRRAQVYI